MDKRRILLVDDESSFTDALKLYLEMTGRYKVRTVNKGMEAVATAKAFRPDLILLDVIMPDVDGGNVASQLKEERELARVPVLFLTAAISREEVNHKPGFIGGQIFMAKPISAREVQMQIDRMLDKPSVTAVASDETDSGGY